MCVCVCVCVCVCEGCQLQAQTIGAEEITGPLFPLRLFAVSDPTVIKIAFFVAAGGATGLMEEHGIVNVSFSDRG